MYHVNKAGETGLCSAKEGNCPFGGVDAHQPSAREARTAYENKMQASFITSIIGVQKEPQLPETRRIPAKGRIEISNLVQNGNLATPDQVVNFLQKKYPELEKLRFSEGHGGYHVLDGVQFYKEKQKQGLGTQFMEDLCRIADEQGWKMALTPSEGWGASSAARLTKFYRRFDFVPNKGRNKDFSTQEAMLRSPTKIG